MNAPFTLMRTAPGLLMVLSISAVDVAVRGLVIWRGGRVDVGENVAEGDIATPLGASLSAACDSK